MITDKSMELLSKAIIEYDKLKGKQYLLCVKENKNSDLCYFELNIAPRNFWHLLGCSVDYNYTSKKSIELYEDCLKGINIKENLKYARGHSFIDVNQKYNTFMSIFNFINNAKITNLANSNKTPDYDKFKYAIGNEKGIIGYDIEKINVLYPKTTQNKSIFDYNKPIMDIHFIFSKENKKEIYTNVEYCITKKIDYIETSVKNIPSEYSVFVIINNNCITNISDESIIQRFTENNEKFDTNIIEK